MKHVWHVKHYDFLLSLRDDDGAEILNTVRNQETSLGVKLSETTTDVINYNMSVDENGYINSAND